MNARRIILGLTLAAGIAACGDDELILPAGPSFNGGHTLGSGGGVGVNDPGENTTTSDSLGRSGHTLGSGG